MIEKILERLEELKSGMLYPTDEERWADSRLDDAISIVKEVAQEYGDGWIPVEQMLEHYYKPLKDKQEQGLLISLPCKVGDTVYRTWTCGKHGRSVAEFRIEHVDIDNYPQVEFSYRSVKDSHSFYPYRFCKIEDIGKTVFLTRSKAEEALAQMKGE